MQSSWKPTPGTETRPMSASIDDSLEDLASLRSNVI